MVNAQKFKEKLFNISVHDFEEQALQLFRWQAQYNLVYQQYIAHLGKDPAAVQAVHEIPFLPINLFKHHRIVSDDFASPAQQWHYFESSGTTGQEPSRHYVADVPFYHHVCRSIFEQEYGSLQEYHIFALLPSYLERQHASLVSMADFFIQGSQSELSGFYLDDYQTLIDHLATARKSERKVLLIGVSFALLELAENYQPDLQGVIVVETGGMKGRRKEIIREELHQILQQHLNLEQVHAEYGMTELFSQAYAPQRGQFKSPDWMRVYIRDVNDPFCLDYNLRYGGINIIDLANIDSCAFIETQDLGRFHTSTNSFEVLGRMDNTDMRGCNLMVSL